MTLIVRCAATGSEIARVPALGWWLTCEARAALAEAFRAHLNLRAFGPVGDLLHVDWTPEGSPTRRSGSLVLLRQSEISPRHSWTRDDRTRRAVEFELVRPVTESAAPTAAAA